MKITKRQLRRIIKEEKAKLLSEGPLTPHEMGMAAAKMDDQRRVKGQSREAKEGRLLGDLASITSAVQEISDGLYGLEDPGDPGGPAGDEMAQDLEMQIERLNEFFGMLEAHFESMDSSTPEFDPNAPGMR